MTRFILPVLCFVSTTVSWAQTPPPAVTSSPQTLLPGQTIQRPILEGESQSFKVSLAKRGWFRVRVAPENTRIRLRVYTPDNGWAAELLAQPDSSYTLALSADTTGKYRIDVSASTADSGSAYTLGVEQYPSDQALALQQSVDRASSWLARNAHPIRGLTAGTDLSDLAPLKTILSGMRIVGLGEATHGTSEFFQARHRIVEYLVREMGFRLFALETSQSAAHAINEFVLYGKGDRAKALASQGFFNWDTHEMSAMLDWMRAYNKSVPAARRVQFAGFDFQYNPDAPRVLRTYLERVAPGRVAATDSLLVPLTQSADSTRPDAVRYYSLSTEEKRPLVAGVNDLMNFLAQNRADFVRRTSLAGYDSTVQMVRLLFQLVDTHITPGFDITDSTSGLVKRDRYMAENIAALLAASPPGTKMVLASHNEHVRRDPYNMGYFLGQRFGSAYYAFALAFGEGDFQALAVGQKGTPLRSFTVGPGFQQSTEWMLARSKPGNYFVDFRPLVRTGSEQPWFTTPRALRSIGNGYAPSNPSGYYRAPVTLGKSYDGIVFIRHTTRAKPNPSVRR